MKIQPKNIESFIKKPPAETAAVLVYGPDEGLVRERLNALAKTIVPDIRDPFNVAEITAEKLLEQPSLLIDEAKSISMLGGRRVILIRGASDKISSMIKETLAVLKSGDNFVLVEAGSLTPRSSLRLMFEDAGHGAAIPCYVDDERDISRVLSDAIKEKGYTISSEALSYMAANVVGDRAVARSEVEKLVIYMGGKKIIAVEDVMASVGASASLSLDDLAKHIATGQFAAADRILNHVLSEGIPAVTILRTLQNHYAKLHITKARLAKGESLDMALGKIRPPLFFKAKPSFESQVMNLSIDQIEQALSIIMSAEAKCKQTGSNPDILVSRAALSLSQMAARRRA